MGIASLTGSPQAFQIVELPRPCRKNVNNKIDIIEKYPFAFRESLDVQSPHTGVFECFFDVFGDRLVVTCGSSRANEEIIGEGANLAEVKHHGVLSFLVECCLDGVG